MGLVLDTNQIFPSSVNNSYCPESKNDSNWVYSIDHLLKVNGIIGRVKGILDIG